jgi:hypothetical protein
MYPEDQVVLPSLVEEVFIPTQAEYMVVVVVVKVLEDQGLLDQLVAQASLS